MNPESWIALAILLTIAEFFIPGLVIIWFAVGALMTSLVSLLGLENIYIQFTLWIIFSLISLYLGVRYIRKPLLEKKQAGEQMSFEEPHGLAGTIKKTEEGYRVLLEKPYHGVSSWSFRFSENAPEAKPRNNMKIKVTGVDGITLIVEPIKEKNRSRKNKKPGKQKTGKHTQKAGKKT